MNFAFSEEQEELRRIVRQFLDDKSDEQAVRALMATEKGFDDAVWRQMADQMGLQGLIVPEDCGGSGYSYVELIVVLEEMGRSLLCAPYFSTVVRGGNAVIAKRVGTVTLQFADGQERAQAHGTAGTYISRAAATLPEDIRQRITARRRAGEEEAATDPLNDPEVRAALASASFELLVGFQLTEDQLAYNATR